MDINPPVVFGKGDSAQKPGLPKLILPAFRGPPTRKERAEGRKPRGVPTLDVGDFSARLLKYQQSERKGPNAKQRAELKEKQEKAHQLRPFFPQRGMKVERADTNAADAARGRLYLTCSNGQVLRADRVARKSRNAHVAGLVEKFLEGKEAAS